MSMSYEWVGIAAAGTMALLFAGAHLWPAFFDYPSGPEPGRGRKVSPKSDPSLELTTKTLLKQAEVEWERDYEQALEAAGVECSLCPHDPTRRSVMEEMFESTRFPPSPEVIRLASETASRCPLHGHRDELWWESAQVASRGSTRLRRASLTSRK